jgi:hypothetical protein
MHKLTIRAAAALVVLTALVGSPVAALPTRSAGPEAVSLWEMATDSLEVAWRWFAAAPASPDKNDSRCSVDPWGCPKSAEQAEARGSFDPWGVTGQ